MTRLVVIERGGRCPTPPGPLDTSRAGLGPSLLDFPQAPGQFRPWRERGVGSGGVERTLMGRGVGKGAEAEDEQPEWRGASAGMFSSSPFWGALHCLLSVGERAFAFAFGVFRERGSGWMRREQPARGRWGRG